MQFSGKRRAHLCLVVNRPYFAISLLRWPYRSVNFGNDLRINHHHNLPALALCLVELNHQLAVQRVAKGTFARWCWGYPLLFLLCLTIISVLVTMLIIIVYNMLPLGLAKDWKLVENNQQSMAKELLSCRWEQFVLQLFCFFATLLLWPRTGVCFDNGHAKWAICQV